MAAAAKDPSEKADFLEVERGWLSLALRYEGPSSLQGALPSIEG